MTLSITITGASGRMGQAVQRIIQGQDDLAMTALSRTSDESVTQQAIQSSDAVIDFTQPEPMLTYAALAAKAGKPFISGTTGLTEAQKAGLIALAEDIPIVWAANMSIGITLLSALTEQVAARLGEEFDIEIDEMHHRHKVDAPSGTALALGEAAARGRGVTFDDVASEQRQGARKTGNIGFSVRRGGDVIGEHTVLFAGEGEHITLSHHATSRDIFASGAVRAARWARDQSPGLYSMRDVLGL